MVKEECPFIGALFFSIFKRKGEKPMNLNYNMVVDVFNNARTNTVEVKKGGKNAITLTFTILNNGFPFDMTDVVMVSCKGVKPDDSIIYAACDISKDEEGNNTNIVTHTLSDESLSVAGRSTYELSLVDGDGNIVLTFDFYIYVIANQFDESDLWSQNNVSAVASYMNRALKAATSAEEISNTFIVSYGQIQEILNELQNEYEYYVDYLNELQQKVADGEFNGAPGPQGPQGENGVVAEGDGFIALSIKDGNLVVYYYDNVPPLSINNEGHLVYTY